MTRSALFQPRLATTTTLDVQSAGKVYEIAYHYTRGSAALNQYIVILYVHRVFLAYTILDR